MSDTGEAPRDEDPDSSANWTEPAAIGGPDDSDEFADPDPSRDTVRSRPRSPLWSQGLAILLGGVAGAATGGIAYAFLNGLVRINQVGLLERRPWPLSSHPAWILAGLLPGVLLALRQVVQKNRRLAETRALAEQWDVRYQVNFELPAEAAQLPLFTGWSTGTNALSGVVDGLRLSLFDCTCVRGTGESSTTIHRTVALFEGTDLPHFDLQPRRFSHRLLAWAGLSGVLFDPTQSTGRDAEIIQQFNDTFRLSLLDPGALLAALGKTRERPTPGDETLLRQLFTPQLMEQLGTLPAYHVQSASGYLALWLGDRYLNGQQRVNLWETARLVRQALESADGNGSPIAISADSGSGLGQQARQFRNTVLGAVSGLLVGLILGFSLWFGWAADLLRGGNAPADPLLSWLWLGLAGLAEVGVATVFGAWLGSRLPVPEIPIVPESPERKRRREQATGCGAIVGLFVGFVGGGLSLFVFDILQMGGPKWLVPLRFFGSIFGGALLGSIAGGYLMNRLFQKFSPPS